MATGGGPFGSIEEEEGIGGSEAGIGPGMMDDIAAYVGKYVEGEALYHDGRHAWLRLVPEKIVSGRVAAARSVR